MAEGHPQDNLVNPAGDARTGERRVRERRAYDRRALGYIGGQPDGESSIGGTSKGPANTPHFPTARREPCGTFPRQPWNSSGSLLTVPRDTWHRGPM